MTRAASGCLMCDSLYVKANGDLPCWDDAGEELILRRLRLTGRPDDDGRGIFNAPELLDIRRAFADGRLPHPDYCRRCAVLGHGRSSRSRPRVMNVLHIEPAYLCQLACPQCFTPRERLDLQAPPYYMPVDFFARLLDRLREEEVAAIRLIHFEGRGDPLLHRGLGEMVALARHRFPDSVIMATSHGNFPLRSWMLDAGLDVLRLSVDGATEESYQRYRVGGTLAAALGLMREIRDAKRRTGKVLHVEWKYILFEWNDGDEELREAARLAREHGARLRFCLTHTPGRSLRIQSSSELRDTIVRLGLDATIETTFQLRHESSAADAALVLAEHVEALLIESLALLRAGETAKGELHLAKALAGDPGAPGANPSEEVPVEELMRHATRHCKFASTASALANVALERDDPVTAEAAFRRYLKLAGSARDRDRIRRKLIDLAACNRLGCRVHEAAAAPEHRVREAEAAVLELDLGQAAVGRDERLARALARGRPTALLTLGGIRRVRGDLKAANALLARYLERLPAGEEDAAVAAEIVRVRAEMQPLYRLKRLAKRALGLAPAGGAQASS